jgi:hypothetical protein
MDTIKYLGVQLDSKLHFHARVNYIFSQFLRTLGLEYLLNNNNNKITYNIHSTSPGI